MRPLAIALALAFGLKAGPAHASFINYSAREINVKIVYYGPLASTTATENLTYVYGKTNPDAKGKLIRLATDDDQDATLFFDFLPLSLGEIRGFKTRFHLYTVVTAKDHGASRALILKGVDGIVFIADADPAKAKVNAASLAELTQHLTHQGYALDKLPVVLQVVGTTRKGARSAVEVQQALGLARLPVFAADPTTGVGVFDTLKAIAKLVLLELENAAPAPASTKPAPAKPAQANPAPPRAKEPERARAR